MITGYRFGEIVIDGRTYTKDVIIFPDSVLEWWRKEGHKLCLNDLGAVWEAKPKVLIVGTGYDGMMNVLSEVTGYCKREKIKLLAERTGNAVEEYNKQKDGRQVVAALHLTC